MPTDSIFHNVNITTKEQAEQLIDALEKGEISFMRVKDTPIIVTDDTLDSQFKWERDIAIAQLADYGVGFGEQKRDLVEVVRCKNCEYNPKTPNEKGFMVCKASGMEITDDDYCSYGERKEDCAGS